MSELMCVLQVTNVLVEVKLQEPLLFLKFEYNIEDLLKLLTNQI